jgi:Tol biopolymer transport system component
MLFDSPRIYIANSETPQTDVPQHMDPATSPPTERATLMKRLTLRSPDTSPLPDPRGVDRCDHGVGSRARSGEQGQPRGTPTGGPPAPGAAQRPRSRAQRSTRRWLRPATIGLTIVTIAVTTLPFSAPAQAGFPGHNGRIVYWTTLFPNGSVDDAVNQILSVRGDGTARRQLTFNGDNDDPTWAPRGHRILYTHDAAKGGHQVWVMNADGSHQRRLIGGPKSSNWEGAWAPGGRRIVLVRYSERTRTQDLYLYDLATHKLTRLHADDGFNRIPDQPAWSPDGQLIAFSASNKGATNTNDQPQSELFTIHPDGTGLTQITSTADWFEETPNWSPDGSRLVYRREGFTPVTNFCEQLDTINPHGTERRRVRAGCYAAGPVWSPNGRRILAYLGRVHRPGLWVMSPTGAHQRFLTSGGGGDWQPLSDSPHVGGREVGGHDE